MKFEVFNDKGERVFFTESVNCVYSVDIQKQLVASGYKLKLNGKVHKPADVKEE